MKFCMKYQYEANLTLGFINDRMILTLMKHHEVDFQDIQLK